MNAKLQDRLPRTQKEVDDLAELTMAASALFDAAREFDAGDDRRLLVVPEPAWARLTRAIPGAVWWVNRPVYEADAREVQRRLGLLNGKEP